MERIKYLRNNGIMGLGSGMLMLLYLAEHHQNVPCMPLVLVLAGLTLFVGIRDFVASKILQDEDDIYVAGKY